MKHFEDTGDYVQSLARGLRVLRAFDHEMPNGTLTEVANRAGLSRAVTRRLLMTLEYLGYIGRSGRSFFPSPRMLELGYSYLASLDLSELAQQSMEQLSRKVGESCSMAVLDGSDIVYVMRVPVRRVMSVALGVGARLPAFATSMGRVILAGWDNQAVDDWLDKENLRPLTSHTLHTKRAFKREIARVRKQGYAVAARELESSLCSIAVPIRGANGMVVAALNVALSFQDDVAERAVREILPELREAERAIEQTIARGGWLPHLSMKGPYE